MANLALFDFDHTLYNKDSLLEFTKYYMGRKYYTGIIKLSPWLIALKLGLLHNENVKVRFFKYYFANENYQKFKKLAKTFATESISRNLNQSIFEAFKKHVLSGDKVFIVTASAAEWIEPWSSMFGVNVIGTKLQVKEGIITGSFDSKNCYGPEKVARISEILKLNEFEKITVYGSGKGDRELLQLQTPL